MIGFFFGKRDVKKKICTLISGYYHTAANWGARASQSCETWLREWHT